MNIEEVAGALAERHQALAEPDPRISVINYAESPRVDDWTLRSALVRLAQPEAARVAAVLEVVRRCDAALQPLARTIEARTVSCDHDLTAAELTADGGRPDRGRRYPDGRVVDLARLTRHHPAEADGLVVAYDAVAGLDPAERSAIPILEVALALDELAEQLTRWAASERPGAIPTDALDTVCAQTWAHMDRAGIPVERPWTGPRSRS